MKKLILLIALAAAGYFAYARFQNSNPERIENPVYAELRVDTKVGSRELNLVLFGDEGDALCDSLRQQFQARYSGTIACIRGRRD
jgi:hypothetical protein